MFAIGALFFAISVIVLCSFFCYVKFVRISDRCARKMEGFGYILLFIVVIWQALVKNIIMDEFYNIDLMQINEKLTCVLLTLKNYIENGCVDVAEISKSISYLEADDYVQLQLKSVDVIESILVVLSTILVAIGRLQELFDKRHPTNQTN